MPNNNFQLYSVFGKALNNVCYFFFGKTCKLACVSADICIIDLLPEKWLFITSCYPFWVVLREAIKKEALEWFGKSLKHTHLIKVNLSQLWLRYPVDFSSVHSPTLSHWFVIPHKKLMVKYFTIMIPLTKSKAFVKFTEIVDSESSKLRVSGSIYSGKSYQNNARIIPLARRRQRRQMSHETNRPHTKLSLNNNYELIPQKIND